MTLLLVVMHLLGGYSFGVLSVHGHEILKYAALDAVGFLFVGLSEEFLLRGYLQFTLGRGLGFWPAAILTSVLFASAHLGNPGEARLGILMVALDGMFCCFVLWRTGNLWWAVGNHAAWDFSQSYLYGVPDSGMMATKHLMNPSFHGPDWLTGGTVGPEGSALIPVLFLVTVVVFHFCYPKREYVLPERG
jgi:membrane protease YdiL (CAAX protease family)